MSDSRPRHLAPRRKGPAGLSRRWLYAGGVAVLLAGGVAVAVTAIRGDGAGSVVSGLTASSTPPPNRTGTPPGTTAGGSGHTPTSTSTATTPPSAPAQPVRTTPGNLLANGDFERDLGGWRPSGGGQVDRVPVGHSGAWSVRIRAVGSPTQPTGAGAGQPGIVAAQAILGQAGRSYEASAWVRASRPGAEAILRLRELGAGGESADAIGVTLVDADWHEVVVVHQIQAGGRLTVEAQAGNLAPGEDLLLDQVSVTAA